MLISTIRFWYNGWIESLFITPKFFFTFYGFDWVKPLDGSGMYAVFILMILAALFITIGLFYRFSTITFFVLFTYVELIDKTNYLNHYYFVSLVALLLCFLPAHRYFSLDVKFGLCRKQTYIPAWCLNIVKFQIGCVYFFAGVAKLNPHWLFEAQPLSNWLKHQTDLPMIGGFMKYDATAFIYSWLGCIFDLSVAFFLLFRKTRLAAYLAIVIFHIITGIMFPIGVFPLVMIALTTVFFSPFWFVQLFDKLTRKESKLLKEEATTFNKSFAILIWVYVVIQLLVPMRYLLYPGKLFWTEQGFRFSWRVMLIEKVGNTTFFIEPENGKGRKIVEPSNYLTPQQIKQMSTQPDMILQFAHYLRDQFENQRFEENGEIYEMGSPKVFVEAYANLFNNGSKLLIDPEAYLSELKYNLSHRSWITEYE